jgi:peroxiredoxin
MNPLLTCNRPSPTLRGLIAAVLLSLPALAHTSAWAASDSSHSQIGGENVIDGAKIGIAPEQAQATVVVFLSATCPCSNSHMKELTALAKEMPKVQFVGVHSNVNETAEQSKRYFKAVNLPFPVVQDEKLRLADEYGALKTPHAFVLNAQGQIVYRGGVSSSHDFDKAERRFLREALDDIQHGRPVRAPQGRALGCAISRS